MLDDWLLDQMVRSQVGQNAQVWRHDRNLRSPMNVVLDAVDELVNNQFVVYWVNGGLPETFSLPDLDPAVVIFNSRYLEMIGTLRGIMTNTSLDESLLADVSERASLRIIAELVLRHGDPGLACQLFVTSMLDEHVYFVPTSLMEIERTPIGEMYIAVWFFALLHELGHVVAQHQDDDAAVTGVDYLGRLVDQVVVATYGGPMRATFQEWERQAGSSGPLHRRLLADELSADLFSVQMLFVAAKRLMRANGNLDDFRSDRLAAEILSMFGLFHYMNSCALVTRQIAGGGADARVDAMVNIANGVRLNAIIEFLALYLASGLDLERPADDAIVDELRGAMLRWHHDSQPRLDSFDRGHSRAMRQGLFPRERRLDAFGQFAELVAQPNSFALLEIRRFCGMAETLGLSHPDLDLLAAMMARPAAAARTVRERQRIHLVAWVKGPDVDQPFSLTAHDGEVVFVFTTGVAADYFVRESRQIVRPGFRLSTTAIASPTEQNVVAILHRMLPDSRSDLQISFEGSAAFDRRFRELNDGTFWPADDADRPEGMSSSDTP